ncbi:MAG: hypothetical protein GF320_02540 [Armatimonadia bacterium]|nr:hypothetical protein [Armatimonadia bacterium]
MILIDSSGWLEHFTDGPTAEAYGPCIEADAIVLATARHYDAELVTGDADPKDLPGVTYIPKA